MAYFLATCCPWTPIPATCPPAFTLIAPVGPMIAKVSETVSRTEGNS